MRVLHKYKRDNRMALSVRLDPPLSARVEEEAKRLGISKSDLVKDALERRLGMKDPYALLREVRSGKPMGKPAASVRTGAGMKARLNAKRSS